MSGSYTLSLGAIDQIASLSIYLFACKNSPPTILINPFPQEEKIEMSYVSTPY